MEVGNLYIVLAVTRSAATLAGNRKNVSIHHPALYLLIDTSSMMHEPSRLTEFLSYSFRVYLVAHTS